MQSHRRNVPAGLRKYFTLFGLFLVALCLDSTGAETVSKKHCNINASDFEGTVSLSNSVKTNRPLRRPLQWTFAMRKADGSYGVEQASKVPGYWNESRSHLASRGMGRYRLNFSFRSLDKRNCYDALYILEAPSAAKIFLNGIKIGSLGRPGATRVEEIPALHSEIIMIPHEAMKLENRLEIFVSNHRSRGGGILGLQLGRGHDFQKSELIKTLVHGALLGFFIATSLIFLIVGAMARSNGSHYFFCCILILAALRVVSVNGYLEKFSPDVLTIDVRLVIDYLSGISLGPVLFLGFLRSFFRAASNSSGKLRTILDSATYFILPAGITLSVAIAGYHDASLYGPYLPAMLVFYVFPCTLFFLAILIFAAKQKFDGAIPLLTAMMLLTLFGLRDGIAYLNNTMEISYLPIGVFGLICCQCIIQGRRIYIMHNRIRRSRIKLKRKQKNIEKISLIKDEYLRHNTELLIGPLKEILLNAESAMSQTRLPHIRSIAETAQTVLRRFRRIERIIKEMNGTNLNGKISLSYVNLELLVKTEKTRMARKTNFPVRTCGLNAEYSILGNRTALSFMIREISDFATRSHVSRAEISLSPTKKNRTSLTYRIYSNNFIYNSASISSGKSSDLEACIAVADHAAALQRSSLKFKCAADDSEPYLEFCLHLRNADDGTSLNHGLKCNPHEETIIGRHRKMLRSLKSIHGYSPK